MNNYIYNKISSIKVYGIGLFKTIILKVKYPIKLKIRNLILPSMSLKVKINTGGLLEIGKSFREMGKGHLEATNNGVINIGNNVFFNEYCRVTAMEKITIKDNCIFGPNVKIYDHDHIFSEEGVLPGYKTSEVIIEKGCWIGANTIILRGTHIGENCVIGAGAIIKGDIPSNSIVKNTNKIKIEPLKENV